MNYGKVGHKKLNSEGTRTLANPLAAPTDRRTQSRRKHPRALLEWPVTVISPTGSYQGKAANISRGGALIHLSHELTVGDTVRLAFEVPDYQDVIVAKGEILRSFPLKRGDEHEFSHSAALRFTEISDENSKYFTGNIAPEWKADYTDTVPIKNDTPPKKDIKDTSYLPWILVVILLVPLCYLVYDSIQRKLDDEHLLSEVEGKLLTIEEQINSLQNSQNILTPLEGQLNDLQIDVSNMKTRLPDAGSLETISRQMINQNHQIENINQKIKHINEDYFKISKNNQQEIEEENRYYLVQKGDNLFQISSRNKITIQELKEINDIGSEEAIFPGQKLKLK